MWSREANAASAGEQLAVLKMNSYSVFLLSDWFISLSVEGDRADFQAHSFLPRRDLFIWSGGDTVGLRDLNASSTTTPAGKPGFVVLVPRKKLFHLNSPFFGNVGIAEMARDFVLLIRFVFGAISFIR